MALNLVLAFAVIAGILAAGSGSTAAAWTVFVLTIPFMAFILPYLMGVALIGRGGRVERAVRKDAVVEEVPTSG